MKFLLFAFFLLPVVTFGQILGFGTKLTEYKASNGKTYRIGDTIKLATGTEPNGDFRYITVAGWVQLFDSSKKKETQAGLPRQFAGYGAIIHKIHSSKASGFNKIVFAVRVGIGLSNFDMDIESAILVCEITDCPKLNNSNNKMGLSVQSADAYDQIKKLKALLDSGALTQAEYDTQKKKILSQ